MHTYMQIITQEKCDSCQVGIILVDYFSLSNFMIYIAEFPRHKDNLIMNKLRLLTKLHSFVHSAFCI